MDRLAQRLGVRLLEMCTVSQPGGPVFTTLQQDLVERMQRFHPGAEHLERLSCLGRLSHSVLELAQLCGQRRLATLQVDLALRDGGDLHLARTQALCDLTLRPEPRITVLAHRDGRLFQLLDTRKP